MITAALADSEVTDPKVPSAESLCCRAMILCASGSICHLPTEVHTLVRIWSMPPRLVYSTIRAVWFGVFFFFLVDRFVVWFLFCLIRRGRFLLFFSFCTKLL